jgi:hypothetical protein
MNRLGSLGCFATALLACLSAQADPVPPPPVGTPAPLQAAPAPPTDTPVRLHVSEYALSSYHLDNGSIAPRGSASYDPTGSNYVDWLNKLQVDASWRNFTAQLRLDSALFANAPAASPGDTKIEQLLLNRYGSRLDFEKVSLAYANHYIDVTLGDTYVTYGRGLVLSLRKVDELGIDTTARGVSVTGHAGGLTVNALGGLSNIINVDPATGRVADNPNDTILGARAEYRFGKWFTPGVDVSHVIYAHDFQNVLPQKSRDQVTSLSATLEAPHLGDFGALYVEYAVQRRLTQDSSLWSSALYASGSAYLGRLTLLLEYKDYRNYNAVQTSLDPTQVPELALSDFYTAAPTLERVQQLVLNNTDVAGGHLRASVKVNENWVPFVSMAAFVDRIYQTRIFDPYAGVELRWNEHRSRASVSGGYRLNQYGPGAATPGLPFQTALHFEYDVNQYLFGPYSIELDGLHVSHHDAQGPNYLDWLEGQAYLSFKKAEKWGIALGYEYYTEAPGSIRSNYVNVNGTWHILEDLMVRLFVGGQRAGIKCVNGVCRNYPAFDGARLEVVAKY